MAIISDIRNLPCFVVPFVSLVIVYLDISFSIDFPTRPIVALSRDQFMAPSAENTWHIRTGSSAL